MTWLARMIGIMAVSVRQRLHYRFDFFVTLAANLIFSGLLYSIWRGIYSHQAHPRLPIQVLLTYVLVGQAMNMARFGQAERYGIWDQFTRIHSGDIALDLIRPLGFQTQRFLESAAFFGVEMLWVNLPTLGIFLLLGVSATATISTAFAFAVSILLAFLVSFSINSMFMITFFWVSNVWGTQMTKRLVLEMLAGTLIPFDLFPSGIRWVAEHLPFQAMAYVPISIYVGRITGAAIMPALASQLAWAVSMLVLAAMLWRAALRRLVVAGG
ncbi:MAG TPA: ABC-2 family transporter protein [Candidatus Dormibacteraeota bacterium]|jgi:ABC-2 type transport system permease protein|nr:ABC-2 family transporter protein [Candidatus Dormibacteraeota bacterium]